MKLQRLVEIYERMDKPKLDALLAYYRAKESLSTAVEDAALAKYHDGQKERRKHPHQYRLSNDMLRNSADALLQNLEAIEGCKSFEDLIRLVENTASHLSGFGKVAIYDTAFRIGGFRDLHPAEVYLHAGTRKGCRALKEAMALTNLDCSGRSIQASSLPQSLQRLQPYDIENFLCIYKGKFADGLDSELE